MPPAGDGPLGTPSAYSTLLQVVARCEEVPLSDAFRTAILGLRSVFGAPSATFSEFDDAGGHHLAADPPDYAEDGWREVVHALGDTHPLAEPSKRRGEPGVHVVSDVIGTRAFHALDLYRRWYGPRGIEDQLMITSDTTTNRVVLTVNLARRGVGESERAAAAAIADWLGGAYDRAFHRAVMHAGSEAMAAELDVADRAVVVVDGQGAVAAAHGADELTTQAREQASGIGAAIRALGAVPGADPVDGPARRPVPEATVTLSGDDGSAVAARLVPAPPDGPAQAVVVARTTVPMSAPDLRRRGLSPREAEVFAQIVQGASSAAVAAHLGISRRTVDKHLERVFRRLGARTRAEAVAILAAADRSGP